MSTRIHAGTESGITIREEFEIDPRHLGAWLANQNSEVQAAVLVSFFRGIAEFGLTTRAHQLAYVAEELRTYGTVATDDLHWGMHEILAHLRGEVTA